MKASGNPPGGIAPGGLPTALDTELVDWDRWVHLPPRDPETYTDWRDIGAWCRQEAVWLWEESGLKPGRHGVGLTAMTLERCAEAFCPEGSANDLFLRMVHPAGTPLPVLGLTRPASGPRDETVRALALADDPEAVEPPVVTPFLSPHLGEGLSTFRYIPQPDHPTRLFACLRYAWQLHEPPVCVVLWTVTEDTAQLLDAAEDVEELARAVRVHVP